MNNNIRNEKRNEIIKDKILSNCKKFLKTKIIKLNKLKHDTIFYRPKMINLSKMHLNCKCTKNIIKKDTVNLKNNKSLISKLKFRNLDNNFVPIKKLSFRKIQSAKNKEIPTIKINKYLQFIKVKGIVNDLLSEKEENKNLSNLLLIRENLKYIINPNKSLDVTLRKNPDNISFFKSYNRQIKYFMNKNHQKIFLKGVHDYHQNIKHYNGIYFNYINDRNSKKKIIKNIFNNSACNINSKYKISKGFDKFKNNFIKSYEEKFDYTTNKKYKRNNNNSYYKSMDESEFNKMMPLEQNMDNIYLSAKQTFINIKKRSFGNIKKIFFN